MDFDYHKEALKTASPHFHKEKVDASALYAQMRIAAQALHTLDLMRKALFYENREYKGDVPPAFAGYDYPTINRHIVHGILGAACEGGEKLDLLIRTFDGEEFDTVNYIEECGDTMWFDTIGLNAVGTNLEETGVTNIKKLRARSGDTFSKTSFNERDLLTERSVLEAAVTPATKGDKQRVRKESDG